MKIKITPVLLFAICVFSFTLKAQDVPVPSIPDDAGYLKQQNDAAHPCITAEQYAALDNEVAKNIKLLKLEDVGKKNTTTVSFSWPLQEASNLTDCSYYIVTAYVDENNTASAITDYNCGTNTYDGHQGTDICIWPFPFYKMDHSQVEVIAAAAGTIIGRDDGHFDRNCSSNSLPANYVIIQHSDGSCALYWHMKENSVTAKAIGQTVVAGEYLGCVGSSGSSTGPHLHFEVWSGTTSATYKDPFSGTCNTLNVSSWWTTQKPYIEPAILKASVHITDISMPGCDTTETPYESTSYSIPFQGPGLSPGYAKFYIFMRNEVSGTVANLSIHNPGGSVFNSWNFNCNGNYNGLYWGFSKLLPTIAGTYTFQAAYNGVTCSQAFDIITTTGLTNNSFSNQTLIYPNPSNGIFTIDMDKATEFTDNTSIEICNVLGAKVYQAELSKRTTEINPGLQSGVYFYKITVAGLLTSAGKLLVE